METQEVAVGGEYFGLNFYLLIKLNKTVLLHVHCLIYII